MSRKPKRRPSMPRRFVRGYGLAKGLESASDKMLAAFMKRREMDIDEAKEKRKSKEEEDEGRLKRSEYLAKHGTTPEFMALGGETFEREQKGVKPTGPLTKSGEF